MAQKARFLQFYWVKIADLRFAVFFSFFCIRGYAQIGFLFNRQPRKYHFSELGFFENIRFAK